METPASAATSFREDGMGYLRYESISLKTEHDLCQKKQWKRFACSYDTRMRPAFQVGDEYIFHSANESGHTGNPCCKSWSWAACPMENLAARMESPDRTGFLCTRVHCYPAIRGGKQIALGSAVWLQLNICAAATESLWSPGLDGLRSHTGCITINGRLNMLKCKINPTMQWNWEKHCEYCQEKIVLTRVSSYD